MSDPSANDAKYIYACAECGYSFYVDASAGEADPPATTTCPQCGSAGARFTFRLGARCESVDC